ncbi:MULTISPECIES: ATP-binding protein [unclassified Streptomyces]|uniref:ATP-binding protein n=1 Tax=unclassified Streptomyces TaxID=2593676 RepID=UPI0006871675|nr:MULTISPECIES: ATP-binding protein [unclassified Streptomyces]MYY00780.1 ATP-binding protein [Streptomyces sp. SID4913]
MRHTGGEVRPTALPLQGDATSIERALLTLAVRDYPLDPAREQFARGIDQQREVVHEWWWRTPDPELAFTPVEPPQELVNRDAVEEFLRASRVRDMNGEALVVFITSHGIAGSSDTHFLRLPETDSKRLLATAVRTVDVVSAALDSHARNVLVIVNTCFAGNMAADLAAAHKEIRPDRRDNCQLDVLVTCGLKSKIEVTRFPTLLRAALERLRRTAGITTPYLSVPDFIAQYALGLRPEEEKKFKLHHLVQGGTLQPSVCLPNPGYVRLPELPGALAGHTPWAAEYWLDRASGRPHDQDSGWYFRGRESLNRTVADFLGPGTRRGVLLVTGCAGSGKSAVLARAVMLSDPEFRGDPLYKQIEDSSAPATIPGENPRCAALLARSLDAAQFAAGLVTALGLPLRPVGPTDDQVAVWSRQLLAHVEESDDPVTIVVDALDEAQEQSRIVSDVLGPLEPWCRARVPGQRRDRPAGDTSPGLRLLISVRSSQPAHSAGSVAVEDDAGLLHTLRRLFPASLVERTDNPASKEDMKRYLSALITESAGEELVRAISPVVDAVWPSFIDARLAGYQLRNAPDPLALARDEEWHRTTLTQGIRGLLYRDLRIVENDGLHPRVALALLKASAYAKGQGVPWGEVWPAIAGVFLLPDQLEPQEWDTMIGKLLSGRLSGYLAQSIEDDRRVYRPAHEELAAELLRPDSDLPASGGDHD